MADPATQFQAAGITVPPLVPSVYHPQYVNVPSQTGELLAKAGESARLGAQQVFEDVKNSRLNPLVKIQMQEEIARNQLGIANIDFLRKNPQWAHWVTSVGAGGPTTTAPVTEPVTQSANLPPDTSGGGGGGGSQQQTITRTGSNTGVDQKTGKQYHEVTPGSNQWIEGPAPAFQPPPTNLNQGMAQGGLVRPFYAQEGGVVPPSSLFASRPPVAPPAAPGYQQAPPQQAAPQQPQQPSPGQQILAQTTSLHPVMSSQTALELARHYDTSAQRAVYHPQGPTGEPSFSFFGPKNTPLGPPVPVSTLVRNGGAGLAAGENLASSMAVADTQQQAQQAQQQLPQPPTTYPTIASDQGGAQGGPPPAPGTQYNPEPYRQAIAQAIANPQNLTAEASQQAGVRSTDQPLPEAKPMPEAKDIATPADTVKKMEADDPTSANSVYKWIPEVDAHGNTKYYTSVPGSLPFTEQRFYKGTQGFKEGYWTGDNWQKGQLLNELGGPQGVPIPKGIKIDQATIDGWTPEQRSQWLRYIRDYKLHPNAPDPTSPEGVGLQNASNAVKDAQRVYDKILWIKQNNAPIGAISADELIRSKEAAWAKSAEANPLVGSLLWGTLSHFGPKNNFADELGQDFVRLNSHLANTPGGTYSYAATPKPEEWGGTIPWTSIDVSVPKTTNVSTVDALNKIVEGDTYDEALGHAQEVLGNAVGDYKRVVAKLGKAGYRPPDEDQKNLDDLANPKKGYIEDPENKMRDANRNLVNGYGPIPYRPNPWFDNWETVKERPSAQPGTSSPTPSPTPFQISSWKTGKEELKKAGYKGEGKPYTGPDGKTYYDY